jgi:ABC-type bacteriocin/lantibiotic exporter with double-glycine peptidase domain
MNAIGDGSWMPAQFWVALAIIFGCAFFGLLLWITKNFLDKQEESNKQNAESLKILTEAVTELKMITRSHAEDIGDLKDILTRDVKRATKR